MDGSNRKDMDVVIPRPVHGVAGLVAESSAALSNGQIVLILLILGISALMLISTRRRLRKTANSPKAYTREQRARLRDEQSLVQEMEEVMARLEEVSSEMQARIDTRFAKLESVLRDADQRIDRLERLLRRCEGRPTIDLTINESADPPGEPGEDSADDPRRRQIYDLADAGSTPLQIAEQTGQSTGEVELILALRHSKPLANA